MVCRELIAPSSPPNLPGKPSPAKPESPPPEAVVPPSIQSPPTKPAAIDKPLIDEVTSAPPARKSRWWLWGLLLLLFVVGCAVLFLSLIYPVRRTITEAPTQMTTSIPAVVADTPTSIPSPTASPAHTATASLTEATPTATKPPTAVATITPLPTIMGIIITPTIAFGPEVNFIQNGDFADDWANGWTLESRGETAEVAIGPATDDPQTRSLHLSRSGPGMSWLAQRVVLTFPVEGLMFRGRFRLSGTAKGDAEGRAFILLRYEDANGAPVAMTVWLDDAAVDTDLWGTAPLPEQGSVISEHSVREDWQRVELPLAQEFAGALSDADMESVRQITVMMGVVGGESCSTAGCEAKLEVAELSLTAETP